MPNTDQAVQHVPCSKLVTMNNRCAIFIEKESDEVHNLNIMIVYFLMLTAGEQTSSPYRETIQ